MRIIRKKLKEDVFNYLRQCCYGRPRAAKAELIARDFGINIRTVNDVVRLLRKDDILIGSAKEKPFGYYLPATEDEIKDYLDTFKAELFDMLKTYNRQKKARQNYLETLKTKDLFACKTEQSGQLAFV